MKNKNIIVPIILLILISTSILNACSNNLSESLKDPTNSPTQVIMVSTDQPTALPTEEIPNNTLFYFAENLPDILSFEIQDALQKYAMNNNLDFSILESLDKEKIKYANLVFIYEKNENWKELAAEFPLTKFIIVSSQKINLPNNVFQIQTSISELYFVAGYVSAMLADDWRVGAILPADSHDNTTSSQIFSNGVKFLCGLCSPIYAPVIFFPTVATIGDSINSNAINTAYGEIAINRPNTIFLPSQFLIEDVAINLKQNGHILISDMDVNPVNKELVDIQIGFDIAKALNEILDLNLSIENHVIRPYIFIEDKNTILSIGKENYLQQLLSDLKQGFISPLSFNEE